jgi:hypothetical protein
MRRFVFIAGFLAGAMLGCASMAVAMTTGRIYTLFFLDQARAPTVGVQCLVGRTPNAYRATLLSRVSLWCNQSDASTRPNRLLLYFSDSGIVVQRSRPSFAVLYRRSAP